MKQQDSGAHKKARQYQYTKQSADRRRDPILFSGADQLGNQNLSACRKAKAEHRGKGKDLAGGRDGGQAEALGLTDYFYAGGVCLVEWSENIRSVLPEQVRKVNITKLGEGVRKIEYE